MARVFIAIGSNVGDRLAHLAGAVAAMSALPGTAVVAASGVFETAPVGPIEQGAFFNAAVELRTGLSPEDLLTELQRIERGAGRLRAGQRVKWGPRTLDLDIAFYDDQVIHSGDLAVPHPRLHERWFVLAPLADLDANYRHPALGMTVGEMLEHVEQRHGPGGRRTSMALLSDQPR
jgi:2-amino-4-hydroxy-6-hydroxymethyldihydropteridine diphosphokinase